MYLLCVCVLFAPFFWGVGLFMKTKRKTTLLYFERYFPTEKQFFRNRDRRIKEDKLNRLRDVNLSTFVGYIGMYE